MTVHFNLAWSPVKTINVQQSKIMNHLLKFFMAHLFTLIAQTFSKWPIQHCSFPIPRAIGSFANSTVMIPGTSNFKVPISSKFLFSHLILHFMQWTSAKNFFDLNKKRFCYECFKTWKSYFLEVDPSRWSQYWYAQSCDIDSGTCDFRLDLSRFFYLCKFSFEVHAKCSVPAFCMNY